MRGVVHFMSCVLMSVVPLLPAGAAAPLADGAEYFDFTLTVEYRASEDAGAALVFRGHWLPVAPLPDGAAPEDQPHRWYGYYTALTSAEAPVGSLADPAGAGLLGMAAPEAREAYRPGDWNTLEISARDHVLEVALNGVIATRVRNERFIGGAIALATADGVSAGDAVELRNLNVTNHGRLGEWTSLFDGESLTGWVNYGEEKWEVRDGAIHGSSGPRASEGYLATEGTWKDFRARGGFRMYGAGNFGLFYHSVITLREEDGYPIISGVQGEVDPAYPGPTGWLYESYRRGWIARPVADSAEACLLRVDEWNEIEIRSIGNHVTTWVNGMRVSDLVDTGHQVFEGALALQLHTGGVDGIAWKELYVIGLDP